MVNHHKAEARLHINSFLMGAVFTVLAILLTLNPEKIDIEIISQLVLSIPLLLFASLGYAKTSYLNNTSAWHKFGWITNNLGYILILNSVGLILAYFSFKILAMFFFLTTIVLTGTYYAINIHTQKATSNEHLAKLFFYLILIFLGGIIFII